MTSEGNVVSNFVRSKSAQFAERCRHLDPSLTVRDNRLTVLLFQSLASESQQWSTCLALWDLKYKHPDQRNRNVVSLDCIFALENKARQEAYAIFIPSLFQDNAEKILEFICALMANSLKPAYVGDLMRQTAVYVSPFACFDNGAFRFVQEAAVIGNFTNDGTRFAAMLLEHPQMVPGESLITYFPSTCKFFASGNYFGVLCASDQRITLQFYKLRKELGLAETMVLGEPIMLEPCGSLLEFATLISKRTKELFFAS